MAEWILIYNIGGVISVAKSELINWDDAETNNVQFLIYVYENYRRVISGQDEYHNDYVSVGKIKDETKYGSLLSDAEWKKTRDFMIYGDY